MVSFSKFFKSLTTLQNKFNNFLNFILKKRIYFKFFLFNEILIDKKVFRTFIYLNIFNLFNIFNVFLSKNLFFTFIYNIRLNYKLKKTKNLKNIFVFNNNTTKLSIFINFLSGFKSL